MPLLKAWTLGWIAVIWRKKLLAIETYLCEKDILWQGWVLSRSRLTGGPPLQSSKTHILKKHIYGTSNQPEWRISFSQKMQLHLLKNSKENTATTIADMTRLFSCKIMLVHMLRHRSKPIWGTQLGSPTSTAIFNKNCTFRLSLVPFDDTWPASATVSAVTFTCRNCGGGDRGRVAIYRPFGEVSLSLNRTVTCMVLKANDRRTSCPCHDEFRGPRSDYVRQAGRRAMLLARWIVRSVPLEIVESSGHEKVPTRGKPGLERPRPRGEMIEGSYGKQLWTPQ
ncbi:uncharacterized protein TNCV_801801 [Trichonephila clavipes]|nr:uncharacterized protein TNCV_801801 [Trichonephila clavipes]